LHNALADFAFSPLHVLSTSYALGTNYALAKLNRCSIANSECQLLFSDVKFDRRWNFVGGFQRQLRLSAQ